MPFLLLILLVLACLPEPEDRSQPPVWLGVYGSIGLTWAGVAVVVCTAAGLAQWMRRKLAQDPRQRERLLDRYASWRFYHLLGLVLVYGLALFVLGWGGVVEPGTIGGKPGALPGTELLILAPLLVALVLSWTFFYDAERALHESSPVSDRTTPYWSRWAYLLFHVRQNAALVFLPVLLLIVVKGLPRLFPQTSEDSQVLAGGLTLLTALTLLVGMPWIVRLVLGLKPMPEGPLRDRLMAASRRLRCRCGNILLWNTRGGVANAMVIGIVPVLRYVVLTDRLVAEMTPDEVEAVFGHEVGHVKHRHMLYYLAFLMISLALMAQFWSQLEVWFQEQISHKDLAMLPLVGLLSVYIFVVFGFLSRRCERQADIYGSRAVSCTRNDCHEHDGDVVLAPAAHGLCPTGIRTFISALEKVACLNGISRDRPGWLQSWQHSTIGRRVAFLEHVLAEPAVEARFQHSVRWLKWIVLLSLGALLLVVGWWSDWAMFRSL
jgi:Zn-dependent protease with chaperone function